VREQGFDRARATPSTWGKAQGHYSTPSPPRAFEQPGIEADSPAGARTGHCGLPQQADAKAQTSKAGQQPRRGKSGNSNQGAHLIGGQANIASSPRPAGDQGGTHCRHQQPRAGWPALESAPKTLKSRSKTPSDRPRKPRRQPCRRPRCNAELSGIARERCTAHHPAADVAAALNTRTLQAE